MLRRPPGFGGGSRENSTRVPPDYRSEAELQGELDLAHRIEGRSNAAESRRWRGARSVAPAQLPARRQFDVIRGVKHFGAEFECFTFGDVEVLHDGNVFVAEPRAAQVVAAAVSEGARCGVKERSRVEPAILVVAGQSGAHPGRAIKPGGVGNEVGAA